MVRGPDTADHLRTLHCYHEVQPLPHEAAGKVGVSLLQVNSRAHCIVPSILGIVMCNNVVGLMDQCL